MLILGQVVPYTKQIIKRAPKHIRLSERAFQRANRRGEPEGGREEERSRRLLELAAAGLERAAGYLRGYVAPMREPDTCE